MPERPSARWALRALLLLAACRLAASRHVARNARLSAGSGFRQEPPGLGPTAPPTTTTPPPTPDPRPRLQQIAEDDAARAASEATRARVAASRARAAAAASLAGGDAAAAFGVAANAAGLAHQGAPAEAEAAAALKEALGLQAKARALLPRVEQGAYAAGRAAAEAEVRRLEAEAADYYRALSGEFQALARPSVDAKEDAQAKAIKPYSDAEMKLRAMVLHYNQQATDTLTEARGLVAKANALATKAVYEQALGSTEMAQQHMMQAHDVIGAAARKRDLATGIHRLAENVNEAIPSYQQALEMAAEHALAASRAP